MLAEELLNDGKNNGFKSYHTMHKMTANEVYTSDRHNYTMTADSLDSQSYASSRTEQFDNTHTIRFYGSAIFADISFVVFKESSTNNTSQIIPLLG